MGESIEYYRKIEERIKVFIEDGNQYLGCFYVRKDADAGAGEIPENEASWK